MNLCAIAHLPLDKRCTNMQKIQFYLRRWYFLHPFWLDLHETFSLCSFGAIVVRNISLLNFSLWNLWAWFRFGVRFTGAELTHGLLSQYYILLVNIILNYYVDTVAMQCLRASRTLQKSFCKQKLHFYLIKTWLF